MKSILLRIVALIACSGWATEALQAADATVNASGVRQTIRGFGGSSAWQTYTDAHANSLFSNGNSQQLGMSILRLRIDPNGPDSWGWTTELANAQKAKARGAIVIASPWTPPAAMKSNNSLLHGSLLTSRYANYAAHLKSFADYMSQNGAPLYAISIQNEPDWDPADYEGCLWTPTQMRDFIKNHGAGIGSTPIIMPESLKFNTAMSDPTLNDPAAAARVSIVGGHLYGGTISDYALAHSKGKEVWMTEHYVDGQNLTSGLALAKEVHDCMTVANMNAYVWWWIKDDNIGFITASGTLTKNGYMAGQFAKFIRPGYQRIDATYNPSTNVYVSAYKSGGKVVVVAINLGGSSVSQKFILQNATASSVTPWVTSASANIAQGSNIAVSSGAFTASLPAQSVTTFVSNGATPPAAPTGLTATAGNGQVSLSWSASSSATSYNIKRAMTSGGPFTTVASPTTTGYVNTGLTNGTAYYYVVSAVNTAGESANSTQASATPFASGSLQIEASTFGGGITIDSDNAGFHGTGFANFPATGGFAQFNNINGGAGGAATLVVRYALGVTTARTGALLVNGVSQPITFPPSGGWATWVTLSVNITLNSGMGNTIRLESNGGDLGNIDEITVTPDTGPAEPAAPTGLTATASSGQVSLSWSASSSATSYNVKRATTSGGSYTTVSSPTGTSYIDTGRANGTTYYYVVSAVNGGGESANSTQASATPQPPAPAAPTGLAATSGNAQISLSWTASSGAASYNVKRATSSGGPFTTVSSPTGTSYVNTGLTNDTTYYYVVSAVNGGGEGADSAQASATPQVPAPAAPTNLVATAGNAQVSLSWTAASGATSYNVKRATTSGGPYTTIASPTTNSYLNTGLTNGTAYYYVVSAVNAGAEGANSAQASATPAVPALSGLLAYEGFGYTSGATIANQTGGFGWGANWSNTGNVQDVSATHSPSLASGSLLTSGGSVKFGPSSAGGSTSSGVYMRQLGSTLGSMASSGSGSVWISMLYLNTTNSVASGFYGEARIGLYSGVTAVGGVTQTAGGVDVLNTGTPATSATILDRISLYNGATVNATSVATPRATTPALLLLKVVADNTTATDTVYLWVNPNLANGEPAIATANASWTTSDLSAVNGLRFQQAGTNGGVVTNIDEIRLGRTFGDVSPSSTLPSPWATADIGTVAAGGSAGHSAGVFTVTGSGAGIGAVGTVDEFRSVHQSGSGDCSIVARVSVVQNTSANAKAGVMIRESSADTAAQASCLVANGTVTFVYRSATGGASTTVPVSGPNPPRWVRVERVGDVFTAAHSADGINWTTVGSTSIAMAASVALGTVVTSQADGTLTTASIDNISPAP